MTMLHQAQSKAEKPRLERSGINRLIQIFVSILLMGLVLFLSAGRLDWPAAWIFLGTYALVILTWACGLRANIRMWSTNAARSHTTPDRGTKF